MTLTGNGDSVYPRPRELGKTKPWRGPFVIALGLTVNPSGAPTLINPSVQTWALNPQEDE